MELSIKKTEQLISFIKELVSIVSFENGYSYKLIKRYTLDREAVILIDESKVYLKATPENGYTLIIREAAPGMEADFITSSLTLRQIMTGIITVDHAITLNKIFVKGAFSDLMNIFQLAMTLLAEGPINGRLRALWNAFSLEWNNDTFPIALTPFETQKPVHNMFVKHIPEKVLRIQV